MIRRLNILISHDGGVGDFVNMSAAIRETRRLYPTAHITLIIHPRSNDLAEHCPYVDEIIPNSRECDWHSMIEIYRWHIGIARKLLRRRFDVVYCFTTYPSAMLLSYMSGARERITPAFTVEDGMIECGPFVAFVSLMTLEVPKMIYGTHSVNRNLRFVDHALHAPVANRETEVWYTPFDVAAAESALNFDGSNERRFYALCMGGTSRRKQWPPQYYAQLAIMIVEREPDVSFVILGGGQMDAISAEIFKQSVGEKFWTAHVRDLTNKINYRQSAAIISLCDTYIGNDTGTVHIAAAVKTSVLSMNCFAADLTNENSIPKTYYPYRVPSVTVQPEHALPECQNSTDSYGCIIHDRPHCIAQIVPAKAFEGYKILKQRIAQNAIDPVYFN